MPSTEVYVRAALDRGKKVPLGASADGIFNGSIGNWVAIGGGGTTAAYDAGVGINGNGSVKIHQIIVGGAGGEVAIPGTFEVGKTYQVLVAVLMEAYVAADRDLLTVELGDFTASDTSGDLINDQIWFNDENYGMPFDEWIYNVVQWTPTADRSAVKLQVRVVTGVPSHTVANDYHVGLVRVIEVPDDSTGFMGLTVGRAGYYNEVMILPLGNNQGFTGFGLRHQGSTPRPGSAILFGQAAAWFQGPRNANGDNSEYDVYVNGSYAYSAQSIIGRRIANGDGADEEYGPDYVGIIKTERSATEVEWAPDGNYDVILLDGVDDTDLIHRWQFETADAAAAANAMPSMGRLPQYAAAPHVGTEEEGESYYDTVLHKSRTWDGTAWQNHF